MTAIKTILVPIDFSDASTHALRYACSLADAFGAGLHVLHAAENPYLPGGYMEFYAPPPEFFEQVEQDARRKLEDSLTAEQKGRYQAVFVHRTGAAAHAILGYLQDPGHIDLVVMATHGRGGVARLMMGSTADKVVRSAPCPVLTLPPSAAPRHASQAA